MPRKLLTALDQITQRTVTTINTVRSRQQLLLLSRERATQTALILQQKRQLPFLDVQALLLEMQLRQLARLIPFITPIRQRERLRPLLFPTYEEERVRRLGVVPRRKLEVYEMQRVERLRPERIRQRIRELVLHRTSIIHIDHRLFTRLETYLWTNFMEQVLQILGKLYEMVRRKLWFLERIPTLEALQKQLLQLYVYAFMEYPKTLNILGMRITPLTMMVLRYKPASIYMTAVIQKIKTKLKALLMSAERRKPEARIISGSRTRAPETSIKREIGVTESLSEDTTVHLGRDLQGKEMFFTALRYAYSMPFWLRRWMAREMGMPENHKYARYFGIGCIPSRRGRHTWKKTRNLYQAGIRYHRDGYLALFKQYDKWHPISKGNKRLFRKFSF